MRFNEKKAAQVAAFFLFQANGQMKVLKLMKLMYLAERASIAAYGEPMIGDRLVSMDNGPVLSATLNHFNGFTPSSEGGWDTWIGDRNKHNVALQADMHSTDELDQLSDADVKILQSIWATYGHMGAFPLADLTHEICPEWQDPRGSMKPISYVQLLLVMGYSEEQARELDQRIAEHRVIDTAFTSALA